MQERTHSKHAVKAPMHPVHSRYCCVRLATRSARTCNDFAAIASMWTCAIYCCVRFATRRARTPNKRAAKAPMWICIVYCCVRLATRRARTRSNSAVPPRKPRAIATMTLSLRFFATLAA